MRAAHLTDRDLESLAHLEPSTPIADHLFSCLTCWRKACEVLPKANLRLEELSSPALQESLLKREPRRMALLQRYHLEQLRIEGDLAAQAAVARVRGMDKKKRKEFVARTKSYHSAQAVLGLLAEARTANGPYENEAWADLALVAGYQIMTELTAAEKADLLAECFSELASARRRSARWQLARDAIR